VTSVTMGFLPSPMMVAIDKILPSHKPSGTLAASAKFKQIRSSIVEIGLIEPLIVTPVDPGSGQHVLLDGHVRLIALVELGVKDVACLIATDDEAYTYNNRVNRLSTVQEHFMIRRAIDNGVSAERLANALSVDISQINKKFNLLEGICPEVAEILKDRQFSAELSRVLRKMKPLRQVECAELMVSANNLSVIYATALLATTPATMLVDPKVPKKVTPANQEQLARMEREMGSVQALYRLAEQTYGEDVLSLMLVRGYLKKLLVNAQVTKYLRHRAADVLEQFVAIVATESLE
jgi:hypothetical protein